MAPYEETLKPTEAAVVAGVAVRDVHRVIDERIIPEHFLAVEDGRRVWVRACSLISFYFSAATRLTAEERTFAIDVVGKRLENWRTLSFAELVLKDWIVRDDFLVIDFAPFLKDTKESLDRLGAARDLVVSDPDILSGTPIIRGTRIPVHDVAASLAAGIPIERIVDAYPALDRRKVELAGIFAEANPPRGRPRAPEIPSRVSVITDRKISRRRKAE
jgi:uncharacterized protein (DUF433 family)